jgi:hypothetical protein
MRLTNNEQASLETYYEAIENILDVGLNNTFHRLVGRALVKEVNEFLHSIKERQQASNLKYINRQLKANFKYAESRHAGYNKRKL